MSTKIAIIGSGISGLSAAWMLHKHYDVTLFEAGDHIGGHSNTVAVQDFGPVDTGFIVLNEATYPNLLALFNHLGINLQKTDMAFGVSLDQGRLEYGSDHIFAQKRNIFSLRYWRMLKDIRRFYTQAPRDLHAGTLDTISLGDYLRNTGYSRAFIDDHIYPMAAAIWSTGTNDIGAFPAAAFVRFFKNHGLLQFTNRPQWYTVHGSSREYIWQMTHGFRDKIRLNTHVTGVRRHNTEVVVRTARGDNDIFDHVIFACHADQALNILEDADELEIQVLSAFPYSRNTAFLHTDPSFMPGRRKAWSSWNYMGAPGNGKEDGRVYVTYWMNRLQPYLPEAPDLFVTLNPPQPPDNDKLIYSTIYDHPQYTAAAPEGWAIIHRIQGVKQTWFCGAWCGYGFHEDGASAGLAVAETLSGLERPWPVEDVSPAGKNVTGSN
jgi:hypothetical protein